MVLYPAKLEVLHVGELHFHDTSGGLGLAGGQGDDCVPVPNQYDTGGGSQQRYHSGSSARQKSRRQQHSTSRSRVVVCRGGILDFKHSRQEGEEVRALMESVTTASPIKSNSSELEETRLSDTGMFSD
ncbi:hypothetical protein NDU88_009059 [Pleurodeles waltl]|uniref:Uncharacterized protein n=1 Tax=Pleurodeles waltl TaxID=8319 RepID=A0AAV7PS81_PLEWA|nr:hypothetical protein NDU88_009059 [Pleurodeles waltl]